MKIQTIVTAAGDSRVRFLDAGFLTPKSLVNVGGGNVIEAAINSYVVDKSNFLVAVNREEANEWGVDSSIVSLFPTAKIVKVPTRARGALASALMCADMLSGDDPLVIAAGDSMILGGVEQFVRTFHQKNLDAGTIVFESSGSRWSYIATDGKGQVVEVSEKLQVGNLATTGVFYFRQAKTFLLGAEWVLLNNAHLSGNFYVSSVMNFLIKEECSVGYSLIQPDQYKSWSRPIDFASGNPR
ncbi:RfbA dTDP-glucose pyrophosphorylase [Microbacteriaceae bacterium]